MNNPRPNPYVGPRSFRTGEKLFGRDLETVELYDLLIAERIVLLHSPSGAGKSSLIHAGLIPRLKAEGFNILPVIRVNLEIPVEFLQEQGLSENQSQFNRYVYSTLISLEESLPENKRIGLQQLKGTQIAEYLNTIGERMSEAGGLEAWNEEFTSTVLIFDQFEEVLTVDPANLKSKLDFFQQIGSALRDKNRWALFAIREDYLAALSPYIRPVPTRFSTTFRLDLLGADAAHEAIENPVKDAGVQFLHAAAMQLVDDLRSMKVQQPDGSLVNQPGPYVEPVQLQVVCYRLWEGLAEDDNEISQEDLAAVGDVNQSLAEYYANQMASIAEKTGVKERLIRDWVNHELISEGGIRSQVMMQPGQSGGMDNQVIGLLQSAHLVRGENRRNATWFELAHDRLIDPVRSDNEKWFSANLSLVQRQAIMWEREKRPEHLFLRDDALSVAQSWAKANPDELTILEKEFLKASQQAQEKTDELNRLEAERQRAEEKARNAARLRILLIIAVVAAIIALIFGGVALNQRSQAVRNADEANIQKNAAEFNAGIAENNANTAQAERDRASTEEAKARLAQVTAEAASTQASIDRSLALEAEAIARVAKEAADANAVLARKNEILANSRQLAAQALRYQSTNPSLANLLAVEAYHTEDTWEARDVLLSFLQKGLEQGLEPYGSIPGEQQTFLYSVALHPTEPLIAWGDRDGQVTLWNFETGDQIWSGKGQVGSDKPGHTDGVWGLDFSPNGKTLASGSSDGSFILWDVASGAGKTVNIGDWGIFSLSYDASGDKLSLARETRVIIYDVSGEPREIQMPNRMSHLKYINSLSWSPNGRWIASAGEDGAVKVWDATSGIPVQNIQVGGKALGVSWSPDSRFLAGGNNQHNVFTWETSTWSEVNRFVHDSTPDNANDTVVFDVAFVGTNALASAGNDNRIILWDLNNSSQIENLRLGDNQLRSLDGLTSRLPNLLASAGTDRRVRLFEVKSQIPLSTDQLKISDPLIGIHSSQTGELVTAGQSKTALQLYIDGNTPAQSIPGKFSSLAFSADGSQMALGSMDGTIRLYNRGVSTNFGEPQLIITEKPVLSLAFNLDGTQIAASQCIEETIESDQPICTNNAVSFWNTSTLTASDKGLTVPGSSIRAMAYHPGSPWLAIASGSTILFYDLETGQPVRLPLEGHNGPITSLAFSPDGRLLVSAGEDQQLILWDASNNQAIGGPLTSPSIILSLAFDAQGDYFYSGSQTGVLTVWETGVDNWIERICNLAGRNLSVEEIRQFLPGVEESHQSCPDNP